jgi:hypothetical protein
MYRASLFSRIKKGAGNAIEVSCLPGNYALDALAFANPGPATVERSTYLHGTALAPHVNEDVGCASQRRVPRRSAIFVAQTNGQGLGFRWHWLKMGYGGFSVTIARVLRGNVEC